MKERPILMSVTTGKPSQRGKRPQSKDGLSWKQRNKAAVNARRKLLYSQNPEKHRARASAYRKKNLAKVVAWNRAYRRKFYPALRSEMIAAYGGKCACCGESEPKFLQLDHIFNDGHIERKKVRTTMVLATRLKRLGWPKDRHQLLCANCNFGKQVNGGVCPHKSHA